MKIRFQVSKSNVVADVTNIGSFTVTPSTCQVFAESEGGPDLLLENLTGFSVWSGDRAVRYFARQAEAFSFAQKFADFIGSKSVGRNTFEFHRVSADIENAQFGIGAGQQDIEGRLGSQPELYRPEEFVVCHSEGLAIGGDENGAFPDKKAAKRFVTNFLSKHASTLAHEPGGPAREVAVKPPEV